jgi:hypothetical protein
MNFTRVIRRNGDVHAKSVCGRHFADAPSTANPDQITLQEEDKIGAYYAGGYLYALPERTEPLAMSVGEYEHEPVRGLPEYLPDDETLVWQGEPDWRVMARRVFHLRSVGIYFALLIAVHLGSSSTGVALSRGLPRQQLAARAGTAGHRHPRRCWPGPTPARRSTR